MIVDGYATNVCLLVVESDTGCGSCCLEDVQPGRHHFWTDSVAGENCEFERLHENGNSGAFLLDLKQILDCRFAIASTRCF